MSSGQHAKKIAITIQNICGNQHGYLKIWMPNAMVELRWIDWGEPNLFTQAYLFNHTTALLLNAYEMYVLMGIARLVFFPNILSHLCTTKSNNMDSLGRGENPLKPVERSEDLNRRLVCAREERPPLNTQTHHLKEQKDIKQRIARICCLPKPILEPSMALGCLSSL